jgi:hypothetical protein
MTDKEKRALLDQIEALVEKFQAETYGPNLNDGKVVWPPNKEMEHADAITTLFDIEDCSLDLTLYDETGRIITDEWVVTFNNTRSYSGSPGHYARKPLKELIKDELQIYIEEDSAHWPEARLLARLLAAFDE